MKVQDLLTPNVCYSGKLLLWADKDRRIVRVERITDHKKTRARLIEMASKGECKPPITSRY